MASGGKSIRELVIKVTQKNAIKVSKDIDKISNSLLEATEYAELFNQTLGEAEASQFGSLIKSLDSIEKGIEEIAKQTRFTTNSITAFRNESIEAADDMARGFDVLNTEVKVLGESMDQLGTDSYLASTKAQKGMEGLTGATEKANTQTKKYTKSQGRLGNAMKDTNRQGTNQTRTFSKMAQQAGGIASAYAIVAANVFALSEGFRILSDAAAVDRLEEVSTVISAGIGVSIAGTAEAMKEATDGAISYQAALRQAAAATAFGFDTAQIEEFTQVARRASVVLGVEMTDALNRVIRGISKAEVELLDELGVTVRLNEAFARYAAEHNIAANSLNSFQRQQALANEVILKSEQNLGAADDALQSTSWEQFGANVSSATNSMLRALSTSEALTHTLEGLNRVFESFVFDSRASATDTPFTRTLEDADGALEKIVAYNNLEKERNRLLKETAKTEEKIAKLRATGAKGGAEGAFQGLTSSAAIRTANDELDLMADKMAALENESQLSTQAMEDFANGLGVSTKDVQLMSDSIQNLSLLSRSLGSDLTSFNNDVMGKDSNPYRGLSSSIQEASKDIDKLLAKNLSLEDSLDKLKISKDQYYQFGNIQGYISLLDDQLEKEFEIQQIADAHGESVHGQLFLAKEQLVLLQQRHQYQQAAAGQETLTLDQKKEQYTLEQKIVGLEERSQAVAYKNLQAQYAVSTAIHDSNSARETALGTALREKETQDAILQSMRDQNAAAAARGDSAVFGPDQLNAQNEAAASGDNGLDSSLNQANVAAQQQALQTLSPDLAATTNSVYALADAWEVMGSASATSAQTAAAAASAMSSTLSGISGLVSAAAGASTSAIDLEIAALENSGLTQEEQEQKSKELNKKKIKEQEKFAKASILISTAQGMMLAIATSGNIYAGLALAAVTAAAGALAYQQASNSASSQLASLEGATSASSPTSLNVGDSNQQQTVDVSTGATAAERSQNLGEAGIYGRASYGSMNSGKSYLVGEHGKELITPKGDASVSKVSETTSNSKGSQGRAPTIFNIQALDAQSFADRMYELAPVMEEYYETQGKHLAAY